MAKADKTAKSVTKSVEDKEAAHAASDGFDPNPDVAEIRHEERVRRAEQDYVTEEEFAQPRPDVDPNFGADRRTSFQPEMQKYPPIDDQTVSSPAEAIDIKQEANVDQENVNPDDLPDPDEPGISAEERQRRLDLRQQANENTNK